ncbi:MAG: FKBP-type peptidyl-prolyl cis-trans isomerase [Flavobacteriales bacterium]|nr:FKBP-type peptidyl-prolyl cis-trans isomerase [Flavobacteriales bacterium]
MRKIFYFFIVIFLFSCQSKFDGYENLGNETYFKLLSFEFEGEAASKSYEKGNYVSVSLKVLNQKDDLIYQIFKYHLYQPKENDFDELFKQLNEGDSAEFLMGQEIFNSNSLGFVSNNSEYLKIAVKLHRFYNEEEYQNQINNYDEELIEQLILKEILKEDKGFVNEGNVLKKTIQEGKGDFIKKGDTVYLKYLGSFINGVAFDSTKTNQDFEYVYGTPGQVIEGFDKVLKTMKNGEKAKIIIPSQLAFGDKGSSTGIVPPYSPIMYNLEITKIK